MSSEPFLIKLHVTAVRHGVTVECAGDSGHYTSTIQIASVGKSVYSGNNIIIVKNHL